jgi:flotillin
MDFLSILTVTGIILVLIVGIGVVVATLYTRAARDKAYVRTGLGGKKVVLDGGSVILPVFHSYSWVSAQSTLRLEVQRSEGESLITADRMRADITAEFYVRVKPDAENIALAAQTLGERTNDAELLKALVEAKFVDGLRSVAATMTLEATCRSSAPNSSRPCRTRSHADLQSNGLELESVSLTRLDQTDIKHFNPEQHLRCRGPDRTHPRSPRSGGASATRSCARTRWRSPPRTAKAALLRLTIEREQRDAELTPAARHRQQDGRDARRAGTRRAGLPAWPRRRRGWRPKRGVAKTESEAHQAKETARIERPARHRRTRGRGQAHHRDRPDRRRHRGGTEERGRIPGASAKADGGTCRRRHRRGAGSDGACRRGRRARQEASP